VRDVISTDAELVLHALLWDGLVYVHLIYLISLH